MELKLKLADVKDKLPEAGKRWIEGLSSQERVGTEIILNNVGIDSFVKHWKVHRDDLSYIRNKEDLAIVGRTAKSRAGSI